MPPAPDAPPSPDLPSGVPDALLGEYAPFGNVALDDAERWPTLTPDGAARLDALRHHPAAPVWVHATGDRLTADDLPVLAATARRFAGADSGRDAGPRDDGRDDAGPGAALRTGTSRTTAGRDVPAWVTDLVERAHTVVPRYRRARDQRRSHARSPLDDLPPVTRDDLRADLASFVPVDVDLSRVLEGTSSGSTGAAVVVPLHPVAVAADLALLHLLVRDAGAAWVPHEDRLGLANLVDQRAAFTYASAMTGFDAASGRAASDVAVPLMARVNLDPGAWRDPADRSTFLRGTDPQVLSSSPLPLLALADLDAREGLGLHPVAVVSGAAHLTPPARARLRAAWGVPVIDLYGLRETGAVASRADDGPFVVVPRRVWVEILSDDGTPVPDGSPGEVVVTTDENPYLPLLRYRTGDRARLVRPHGPGGRVELHDLEGRSPVRYLHADGRWLGSVDATQVLQAAGIAAWQLHQRADGTIDLTVVPDAPAGGAPSGHGPGGASGSGGPAAGSAAHALRRWIGRDVVVTVTTPARLGHGRARRYSSDVPSGQA
ncbi:AMP-binding protein [Oerskovia enterophila]|uniref:Phenylacetate-coenzyme A ligase n=1 Tax=Oerskovia enterophila TaxID=43678 RepID=A0A163RHE4_9CELL|nr:AMP-binding protein [Oerskovia enterophila]KZM35216.1 phenylacetate-coenzyme A ligase [Oerskovia enterophila]